jgi:prepilin-type N-terminal cleavage/methylation domain-containing protein
MRRRRGFTLVELLVVITIIGILISLLLPAVQATRESARMTQCQTHLKQLGQAFQNHEMAVGVLPSAGGPDWTYHMTYENGHPAVSPNQHGGWGFQILPYIEQEALWLGTGLATDFEKSIRAVSTPNPLFFCPSRRLPEVVVASDWYQNPSPNSGKTFGHAKLDYAASCLDSTYTKPDGTKVYCQEGMGAVTNTFVGLKAALVSADIRDGLSCTLLLGEKRHNLQCLGKLVVNDNEGYTCGWNHDTSRYVGNNPLPDFYNSDCNYGGEDRFGSSHASGFYMVLCDNSVKFLSYNIDMDVFRRLGCRCDALPVAAP